MLHAQRTAEELGIARGTGPAIYKRPEFVPARAATSHVTIAQRCKWTPNENTKSKMYENVSHILSSPMARPSGNQNAN
eukprot:6173490-Pleurochrysis_carterae.AAC.1